MKQLHFFGQEINLSAEITDDLEMFKNDWNLAKTDLSAEFRFANKQPFLQTSCKITKVVVWAWNCKVCAYFNLVGFYQK